MKAVIKRINVFKEVFRDVIVLRIEFNIPKLYAITYFPIIIHKFGTPDDYDIIIFEALYKNLVKIWY